VAIQATSTEIKELPSYPRVTPDYVEMVHCQELVPPKFSAKDIQRIMEQMHREQVMYGPYQRTAADMDREQDRRHREEEQRRADGMEAERVLHHLGTTYPDIQAPWYRLLQHTREGMTERAQIYVLRFVHDVLRHYGGEAWRENIRKANAELLDLCERLVKAFDDAREVEDLRASVEELDSMLYEIEERHAD